MADEVNGTSTPSEPNTSSGENRKRSFFSRFKKGDKAKAAAQKEQKHPPVKFVQLFRHATRGEKVYMAIACISAIIHGSLMPVFTILFGGIIDEFQDASSNPASSDILEQVTEQVGSVAKWFLVLGGVAFVTSLIQVRFQMVVAQGISARLRHMYFESLLSQDFTWYGQEDGGELTARVAGDVNLIQGGIGDKVTSAVQFFSMFVVGVIIAFVYGPLLTLVILSIAPLMIAGGAVFAKIAADSSGEGAGAYGSAGGVASEVISLIRVVTAYNGQETEARRYEVELQKAFKTNVKKSIYAGLGFGFTMFIIFCAYAIAFTFGANRVRSGAMSTGDILTTFFSVFIACFSIGQSAPSFQAFAVAQGAAPRVYEIIDRESEINPLNEDDGEVIPDFKGNVSFKNVNFNYKNRISDDLETEEDRRYVLENFNLSIPTGTSHALVGASGCGKSTTVRLIERFYDVSDGAVKFDDYDVRALNVKWLRSQIGYVGQMPTLFARSIRDNIALGASLEPVGDEATGRKVLSRREVTDEEIVEAAKKANAHDFIMKLPERYDTMLGERGALLSGGQKQRVCIARALVRNPKILILDEATAALDAQSERIVQKALEAASAGRTTITIAHRLSTVKNADIISVIDKGVIVESGTHKDLLSIEGGAYRTLIEHQNLEAQKAKEVKEKVGEGEPQADAMIAKATSTSVSKSIRRTGAEEEDELPEEAAVDKGILLRAFKVNRNEWFFILMGIVGATLNGASFPAMAIIFAEVINEILVDNSKGAISKWALLYVAIGGAAFLGNFLQHASLGYSGEQMTLKLRRTAFRAILKQDMGFFDMKKNSLGALTTRLATEATAVKGLTGDVLGSIAFGVSTILTGFLIAYISCWRVALVVTTVFPLSAISQGLQLKMMTGFDADSETRYAAAGTVASEAVDNFETVTSIGVQDVFLNTYKEEVNKTIKNGRRTALVAGIAFGLSEFIAQALWAVSFWIGSIFVRNRQCEFVDLMKAITGLLFGGMMLGNLSSTMPDWGKAKIAATRIFRLLDRESSIDPTVDVDFKEKIEGNAEMKKVEFEYPSRPNVGVLRGLSVEVKKGQTLALVGASGCGKSTVVGLLERFYDARSGSVTIDGSNITEYDVKWVRKHMGVVAQEPDLFNRSVRDNIAYGLDHVDGTPVTDEMIIAAAKAANAHSFISELEEGYDTVVGARGTRLSGGQRQRVAIARALVREPKILLLDEATSALDAVSERVVQQALDRFSRYSGVSGAEEAGNTSNNNNNNSRKESTDLKKLHIPSDNEHYREDDEGIPNVQSPEVFDDTHRRVSFTETCNDKIGFRYSTQKSTFAPVIPVAELRDIDQVLEHANQYTTSSSPTSAVANESSLDNSQNYNNNSNASNSSMQHSPRGTPSKLRSSSFVRIFQKVKKSSSFNLNDGRYTSSAPKLSDVRPRIFSEPPKPSSCLELLSAAGIGGFKSGEGEEMYSSLEGKDIKSLMDIGESVEFDRINSKVGRESKTAEVIVSNPDVSEVVQIGQEDSAEKYISSNPNLLGLIDNAGSVYSPENGTRSVVELNACTSRYDVTEKTEKPADISDVVSIGEHSNPSISDLRQAGDSTADLHRQPVSVSMSKLETQLRAQESKKKFSIGGSITSLTAKKPNSSLRDVTETPKSIVDLNIAQVDIDDLIQWGVQFQRKYSTTIAGVGGQNGSLPRESIAKSSFGSQAMLVKQ